MSRDIPDPTPTQVKYYRKYLMEIKMKRFFTTRFLLIINAITGIGILAIALLRLVIDYAH